MNDWNPWYEAVKALYSLLTSVVTLGLGWFIGQQLTYRWNVRQKRRELQMAATQQFYAAYGEFFAVWKLWNRLERALDSFSDRQWELHKRASAAEAIIEGTLVKISSELKLSELQIATLGRFRQAFQQLRQAIRSDQKLEWYYAEHPEYRAFKELAVRVAALLGSNWSDEGPIEQEAAGQLLRITSNDWEGVWVEKQGF